MALIRRAGHRPPGPAARRTFERRNQNRSFASEKAENYETEFPLTRPNTAAPSPAAAAPRRSRNRGRDSVARPPAPRIVATPVQGREGSFSERCASAKLPGRPRPNGSHVQGREGSFSATCASAELPGRATRYQCAATRRFARKFAEEKSETELPLASRERTLLHLGRPPLPPRAQP